MVTGRLPLKLAAARRNASGLAMVTSYLVRLGFRVGVRVRVGVGVRVRVGVKGEW